MPRSIPAAVAADIASLGQTASYLLLVKITVDGLRELAYDAQTVNFNVGRKLTGGTSGSTAKIIFDDDNGTTGTLTLWDMSDHFENNETIVDDGDTPGSATSNGTDSDATETYYLARNPEDVSWDGETWDKAAIGLDVTPQNIEGKEESVTILIQNSDPDFCRLCDSTDGIVGSTIDLYLVSSDHLDQTYIVHESYKIRSFGHENDGTWLVFELGKDEMWDRNLPADTYQWGPCMHRFKEPLTCQYSGVDTSCAKTLTACIAKNNEDHFGAFPSIPGGVF